MVSNIVVDTRGAFRKLLQAQKAIDSAGTATVQELVEFGKQYARQYVPKYSYQTYNSISGKYSKYRGGITGTIYIENTARDEDPELTTVDVAWMIQNPGKKRKGRSIPSGWVRSGSTRFMSIAREAIERRKITVAEGNFKQIKIR